MSGGALKLLLASSCDANNGIHNILATHFPAFHLQRVDSRHALSKALKENEWHIIFSEMQLSDFSANDLPELLKKYNLSIPVALITDTETERVALRCLEHGVCQLVQCDSQYIHHLPDIVTALLKRADSERQQSMAEQQLIINEEQYLDIFNNTNDLIQCVALDGSFIYTNRAWRNAMGYTQEEIKSLNLIDILHSGSKACCSERFERIKQGENLPSIEFKFVNKVGETLHLIGDCGPIFKDGDVISSRGIFKNVTETVRIEQALVKSEKRFQVLYDLAPDIYTTINNTGVIQSINQTGIDMLGYTKVELVGQPAIKLIHSKDQERVSNYVKMLFDGMVVNEGIEYRKIRKDGSELWVHECARLDETTDEPRLLNMCRDITVRRELQEKLAFHASHDSLTKLINRRELKLRLQRVLSEMKEHESHIVCYFDLDDFKIINDANGHAAGDELLREITKILRDHLRSRDTLARLGGDEFVVLMEHCPLSAAIQFAEKLQTIIAEYRFHWRAQMFSIGVSMGVTKLQMGMTVDEMLSQADAACYRAKRKGRNCIEVEKDI